MVGKFKSYRIRSQVVSYAPAELRAASKVQPAWQQLNLATANYLTLTASINDVPISAIIDTGATRSIINRALAQRLSLPVSGTASASGLTQRVSGTLYRAATLGLSGITIHDIDISSYDVSAVEEAASREFPLIIGQDFLATSVLEVDFPHDKGRLRATIDSDRTKGFTKLPISLGMTNLPQLQVSLEERLQCEAIIDLGSNVLCSISEEFAQDHGMLDNGPISTTMNVGAEGTMISQIFSLRELRLGPFRMRNVPVCVVSNWKFSQPVNLGWPCFTAFEFQLSAPDNELWLAADTERLKQPIPRDRSGIAAARLPDRLLVRHVAQNSPASFAGLREGDEIVAINGRAVAADYPAPGERQGEKPAGTCIDMTLVDGRVLAVILADYF